MKIVHNSHTISTSGKVAFSASNSSTSVRFLLLEYCEETHKYRKTNACSGNDEVSASKLEGRTHLLFSPGPSQLHSFLFPPSPHLTDVQALSLVRLEPIFCWTFRGHLHHQAAAWTPYTIRDHIRLRVRTLSPEYFRILPYTL